MTSKDPRHPAHTARASGKLDATEVADAAMTAALVVALLATGRVLAAGPVFQLIASFVVAVLAARRRTRVVMIATAASACIAIILGGLGPVSQAILAGVFGWCGGQGLKRGWGRIRSVAFTLLVAWPSMVAMVLFVFPAIALNRKLRELLFENIENQAQGTANILGGIGGLFDAIGLGAVDRALNWSGDAAISIADFLIDNWLLLIPATEFVYSTVYALMIRGVGGAILRRLDRTLVEPALVSIQTSSSPEPVPVRVPDVELERNGAVVTRAIDLSIGAREHVVIEGPNGAGKSTVLDSLAGLRNHDLIERAGPVGLGSVGGTARVGQRPEAQVVGTTVDEDLRWGLDTPDFKADEVLNEMGLRVPADRPTSELSGGELQRLALASALRRRPQLLLVDEVTSMLDPGEQTRIIAKLDALDSTSVVRTTHRNDNSPRDRLVRVQPRAGAAAAPAPAVQQSNAADIALRTIHSSVTDSRLVRLRDVGFVHNEDKPWALDVLSSVNLTIHRYEMVIIEGRNGSGKTTLARILAGLTDPTSGDIEAAEGIRRALAHQHVRLQLLRATVSDELHSLAGVRSGTVDERLRLSADTKGVVGGPDADRSAAGSDDEEVDATERKQRVRAQNLETSVDLFELGHLMSRRIDELSGGEQRRVLLAGLVARGVSLLVLDEPLAGLDAHGRSDLAHTLDQVRLAGTSIVVVSHDVEWSPSHVDQRLRLTGGKLEQVAR